MVGGLWREKQISSSLWKIECAHGEGVSGWRKQGAEIQSGTVSATLLELENFKEGSGRSRAWWETVQLVVSRKGLKLLYRKQEWRKELCTMQADSTEHDYTIIKPSQRETGLCFFLIHSPQRKRQGTSTSRLCTPSQQPCLHAEDECKELYFLVFKIFLLSGFTFCLSKRMNNAMCFR